MPSSPGSLSLRDLDLELGGCNIYLVSFLWRRVGKLGASLGNWVARGGWECWNMLASCVVLFQVAVGRGGGQGECLCATQRQTGRDVEVCLYYSFHYMKNE